MYVYTNLNIDTEDFTTLPGSHSLLEYINVNPISTFINGKDMPVSSKLFHENLISQ